MSRSHNHTYKVLYRHTRGKAEEEEELVELMVLNGGVNIGDAADGRESASDRELRTEEDSQSLLREEEEIDEEGVAKDYEAALKHIGFGLFHVLLVLINGVALLSDAVEVVSVGFVLPILQEKDEFGATDAQNAVLSSVVFIGMLFGSYGWGGFADIVGRRFVLLGSLTLNGVFGAVSAFSPNIAMFIVCRFISGIGVGGSLPVIYPYIAEFTRNKYRGPYMGAQGLFWTFGRLLCGGLAWIILPLSISRFHSWRLFIVLTALPALIGALLYFLLPESPRYLLEHGHEKKALNALRIVHKLNHLHRRDKDCQFHIKRIRGLVKEESVTEEVTDRKTAMSCISQRLAILCVQFKQVLNKTRELYSRKLVRRTILLNTILFTLAFGAYGVLLWSPSYVREISDSERRNDFKSFCRRDTPANTTLSDYCGCEWSSFSGQNFTNLEISNIKLADSTFHNVEFTNVTFSDISMKRCNFTDCVLENVWFKSQCLFNRVSWNQTVFTGVNTSGLSVCDGEERGGSECGDSDCEGVNVDLVTVLKGRNTSCEDVQVECEEDETGTVYRDLFLVSASTLPGNIVSAIAVYFLRRNYWMAFSMFLTTLSVFALYLTHTKVYVVVILCIFTAFSAPAWNDSSLLITELYPTHLRSTSMGVHLVFARVGAILGTNLFGLFIHVNPSIPILLIASVLLVGTIASLPLPKTTRKTLLQ